MLRSLARGLAVGSAALLVVGIGAGTAQAADHTIHQDNTTTLNGLANGDGGNASHSFQQDGLHIDVPDGDESYYVTRWLTNTLLSQVHTVDYDCRAAPTDRASSTTWTPMVTAPSTAS